MADGFHAIIKGTQELNKSLERIDKSVDRATMYAVRQAGREVKQEAKRAAPVLKGGRSVSRKAAAGGNAENRPVSGLLRSSIHSSKRLGRHGPGAYSVRVAPRGQRVHLYSQRIEALVGFMAKAHDAVAPRLEQIAAEAWQRATRGRK